jgi:hypothetical protein
MPRPRPGRVLAIVLAVLIALPSYAFGQVWKPRSQQKAAKAKASPTKNTRKAPAKTTSVKRSKKVTPKKKKAVAKKKKRRVRDEDDFSITEENYPDED